MQLRDDEGDGDDPQQGPAGRHSIRQRLEKLRKVKMCSVVDVAVVVDGFATAAAVEK